MNNYFVQGINRYTKEFYVVDENNIPIYECTKTGFIEGYSIKRNNDKEEISTVKYHQYFIIPGFKVVFKSQKNEMKVRESFLHDYVIKGSNISIKQGDDIFTKVIYNDTKRIADLIISLNNPMSYEIKVYDINELDSIISICVGIHIINYMGR